MYSISYRPINQPQPQHPVGAFTYATSTPEVHIRSTTPYSQAASEYTANAQKFRTPFATANHLAASHKSGRDYPSERENFTEGQLQRIAIFRRRKNEHDTNNPNGTARIENRRLHVLRIT